MDTRYGLGWSDLKRGSLVEQHIRLVFSLLFMLAVGMIFMGLYGFHSRDRLDDLETKLESEAKARRELEKWATLADKQISDNSVDIQVLKTEIESVSYSLILAQNAIMHLEPDTNRVLSYRIAKAIVYASESYGFDPLMIVAIAKVESEFNPQAKSKAGAWGLLQIMEKPWCKTFGIKRKDLLDLETNAEIGIAILDYEMEKTCDEDIMCALAQYHGSYPDMYYSNRVMRYYDELIEVLNVKEKTNGPDSPAGETAGKGSGSVTDQ